MTAFDNAADAILSDANLAEDVVLSAGSPDTIKAVVEAGHVAVDLTGTTVSGRQMTVTCRSTDVDHLRPGTDTVTVRGTTYSLADIEPDDGAMTTLILERP